MRRKTDKFQFRMPFLLLALNALLSILAAVIGYKAISALDDFKGFLAAAQRIADRSRSLVPDGF